jgi:DNA-binding transcriptional MerR regulator
MPGRSEGASGKYGEDHVRRLRLVRALVETGSLPIAKVREILATVEEPEYARAAEAVAEADLRLLSTREDRDEILGTMIVGAVLGDALLAALRHISQVEISARIFNVREREPREADVE